MASTSLVRFLAVLRLSSALPDPILVTVLILVPIPISTIIIILLLFVCCHPIYAFKYIQYFIGEFLPGIILSTLLCYYHRGIRLNAMERFCLGSLCSHLNVVTFPPCLGDAQKVQMLLLLCCCLHIKSRSDLYSILSNIRTGPTDANAFRGHRLTTQKRYTLRKNTNTFRFCFKQPR